MSDTDHKDFAPTKDEAPAPTKTQGASGVTPSRKFNLRSTATEAQLQRIIEALRISPKTTDDLRAIGVYQTSARVWTLRQMGYVIDTTLFNGYAADGLRHARMARYTLLEEPKAADGWGMAQSDLPVIAADSPQQAEGA